MKQEPTIQELEARKDELLRAFDLPGRLASGDVPSFLEHIDLGTITPILERTGEPSGPFATDPEIEEFFTDFIQRSEEGLRACLTAEIRMLEKAGKTGQDHVTHTAFGMLEAVFPVKVRGEVVHGLWCGKLRDKPFTAGEISEIAEVSGVKPEKVKEAADVIPVLSPAQVSAVHGLCRLVRDSLEQALTHRIKSVKVTQQLLQSERTRSLGTLSGGVAHHFNNLLSVILGYSSFVLNREDHSPEVADALRKITEAAQRGRRLTEEILSFAGGEAEEEVPCHVHEMLTSVLSLLESQVGSRIRVETQLRATNDVVLSVPSSIHQVVFNLLSNAIDSTPAGGVLRVSTNNPELDTEAGKGEYLQLEVADSSGVLPPGLAKGDLDQHAASATLFGDRSELRLSSVYGIVGRLDGTVTVATDPGEVTRVEVLLPTSKVVREAPESKRVRRRILPSIVWVIDDDPIFREMCKQVLSEDGHDVRELTGGPELQAEWKKKGEQPNLMVIDFSMPDYNGLELCEWLRAQGSRVPVILVSGFSPTQPDIKKALKIKKTLFLQKPFTSRDLTDTVTVAMGETLIGDRPLDL